MKITDIEGIMLRLPVVRMIGDGCQNILIIKVHTDAGITGIGEAHSNPLVSKAVLEAVNRAFVRKFFPNENPLGKILLDGDKKTSSEIVAVVSDYRALGAEEGNRPTIFHVTLQMPRTTLLVRGGGPPQTLAGELRNAIWSLDRNLPAAEVRPMEYYVDEWLSQRLPRVTLPDFDYKAAMPAGRPHKPGGHGGSKPRGRRR